MSSHELTGKGYINTENSQIAFIGTIFTSTHHTKQLNPWPNSLASHVVNYSQLSVCQGEMEPFDRRLFEHLWTSRQASETSHSKSSLSNFQHQYLPELLVYVYSCHVMVKSMSGLPLCVWKVVFLKSVT